MSEDNDNNLELSRLSLQELRKIEKYKNVSDEDGEAILDDALAIARMILDCII